MGKMISRQIITIDEDKCTGCELCVKACHEGAIGMKNGKAVLLRDDYCDGLGDCLPSCPTNAITFVTREALKYDEIAVLENMKKSELENKPYKIDMPEFKGCPGSMSQKINKQTHSDNTTNTNVNNIESQLTMWPVQLQLVAPNAQFFDDADVLLSADCCSYAYGNFHNEFMKNKVTLIGCPKLDNADYYSKLLTILKSNNIRSLTVTRMEVPCCGGLTMDTKKALDACGKNIETKFITLSRNGKVKSIENII